MPAIRINYVGPAALAMSTVTRLADADGIDLTSSEPPVRTDDAGGTVVLAVMVEGTDEAVAAALRLVRGDLPAGATVDLE